MKNKEVLNNIKNLVKGLYGFVEKNSSSLTLKSMHDCAQVIAKIHGFNSWNELKQNLTYLKKDYIEENIIATKPPHFSDVKIKKNEHYIPLKNTSHQEKNKELPIERALPLDVVVGLSKKDILKTSQAISLTTDDFILLSSIENKVLFPQVIEQVVKFKNNYIHLGVENNIKLDPWSYIFNQNGLELLFKIKENNNNFMISWISTFRYLHNELGFIPSIKESIHYLSLTGIVEVYDWLKTNKPNAIWYLEKYLENVGVKELRDEYFIPEESYKKHWKMVEKEITILENLQKLYNDKVFEKNQEDTLWNYIVNRKNIKIAKQDNLQWLFKELVSIEIHRVFMDYEKLLRNKFMDNYKVWFFCDSLEEWDSYSLLTLNEIPFLIRGYISQGKTSNLQNYLQEIEQILFGKNFNIEIPQEIMFNLLNQTKYWEDNIWFNNKKILKDLKVNEYYLWHREKDLAKIKELRDFICEKVVL